MLFIMLLDNKLIYLYYEYTCIQQIFLLNIIYTQFRITFSFKFNNILSNIFFFNTPLHLHTLLYQTNVANTKNLKQIMPLITIIKN